ncbi:MAG: hypothetical protein AB7N65_15285 [Vicinamibacterales bacterium]
MAIGFQNGHAPHYQSGVAEFWLPGDHVVTFTAEAAATAIAPPARHIAPTAKPPVEVPEPELKRSESRRSKSRKRTGRSSRKPAPRLARAESIGDPPVRQLPIVTFGDGHDERSTGDAGPSDPAKAEAPTGDGKVHN